MRFKASIFALACSLSIINAYGQIRIGPEAGVNIGSISRELQGFSVSNSVRAGLRAGAIADMRLMDNLYLQPGIFYSMRGTKSTANVFIATVEQTFAVNYLELPVNIQYKTGKPGEGRLFVGIGPYLAYALGGTVETDVDAALLGLLGGGSVPGLSDTKEKITVGTDSADAVRPFDIGANMNIGYELPFGLVFRGQMGFGFMNTAPLSDVATQKNWGGSITIAYLFGFNKAAKKE